MIRYFAQVEYEGTHYHGFQSQRNTKKTVQYHLEEALGKVGNEKIGIVCSGRTDTGVHALNQVIHFDTKSKRSSDSWVKGGNRYLPSDITIKKVFKVNDSFHARFSATSRTYVYLIRNSKTPGGIDSMRSLWCSDSLDEKKMNSAAKKLLGEKDFSSFRAAGCQSKSSKRKISFAEVTRANKYIMIRITANAFMLNMMRIIVGTLINVGKKEISIMDFTQIIKAKNRRLAGKTVSPSGLYFIGPSYDDVEYLQDDIEII
jgi:tRNA pseudouridine38-40 synthase